MVLMENSSPIVVIMIFWRLDIQNPWTMMSIPLVALSQNQKCFQVFNVGTIGEESVERGGVVIQADISEPLLLSNNLKSIWIK